MSKLHPTLWRTCRILAGPTRLKLFRRIVDRPEQTVTGLADQLEISIPRASQELRRLQSRGLSPGVAPQPECLLSPGGGFIGVQRPAPACRHAGNLRALPEDRDDDIIRTARGLTHARRLVLMRLLLVGALDEDTLADLSGVADAALHRHLRILETAGMAERREGLWQAASPSHPLARALLDLLQAGRKPVRQADSAPAS
jgi:DNA-binding MarR family transcriptional regulator